jgi:hypothetical protein
MLENEVSNSIDFKRNPIKGATPYMGIPRNRGFQIVQKHTSGNYGSILVIVLLVGVQLARPNDALGSSYRRGQQVY